MKSAIFLLALCAFQTVFANLIEELNQVQTNTLNELQGIVVKHENDVDAEIEFLLSEGASDYVWRCKNEYDKLVLLHESHKKLCQGCYKRGLEEGKMKNARKCYGYNLNAFKAQDKAHRELARKCLTSFHHLLGPRDGREFHQIRV